MTVIEYSDKKVELDDQGYLIHFDEWSREVACAIAEREGIEELTDEKIDILEFIRDYYRKYNFFPVMHAICKNVHQKKDCVSEQFMNPIMAWKIAGLPNPDDFTLNVIGHGETPG
jgi:TusE/DsrC/DsvC family sulfur relay protein